MSLTVTRATPDDAERWDTFVEHHPDARFCHLWGFRRVLEGTFGYRCIYLNISSGGETVGVFPSVAVRNGSGRLISQPFNEYGGPLTVGLSTEESVHLTTLLLRTACDEDCRFIEIRGGTGCEHIADAAGWVKKPLHSCAILMLDEKERLWRGSLTNEARKDVNRARKAGLTAEIRRGFRAVEDPFYKLYLLSMKRLGVPPHPKRFFTQLAAELGDRVVSAWVRIHAEPVAVLLGVITGERIQIYVTASNPQYWSIRPNDLAHWELINWSVAERLAIFDFGSARYPGQIQFKKKWGVRFHEYCYYVLGSVAAYRGSKFPSVQSSSRQMAALAYLWRRFVPLRLTAVVGPPIRKYLTK